MNVFCLWQAGRHIDTFFRLLLYSCSETERCIYYYYYSTQLFEKWDCRGILQRLKFDPYISATIIFMISLFLLCMLGEVRYAVPCICTVCTMSFIKSSFFARLWCDTELLYRLRRLRRRCHTLFKNVWSP